MYVSHHHVLLSALCASLLNWEKCMRQLSDEQDWLSLLSLVFTLPLTKGLVSPMHHSTILKLLEQAGTN